MREKSLQNKIKGLYTPVVGIFLQIICLEEQIILFQTARAASCVSFSCTDREYHAAKKSYSFIFQVKVDFSKLSHSKQTHHSVMSVVHDVFHKKNKKNNSTG